MVLVCAMTLSNVVLMLWYILVCVMMLANVMLMLLMMMMFPRTDVLGPISRVEVAILLLLIARTLCCCCSALPASKTTFTQMCQRLSNICFRQHPPSANRYVHVCTRPVGVFLATTGVPCSDFPRNKFSCAI